jgi:uncharacterized protein YgbK (DUF1537 family)
MILTSAQLATALQKDQEIAQALSWITKVISEKVDLCGLVVTGGDTAMAVLQSLDCHALWLHGEIEPGIPWGQLLTGSQPGLAVVTKAGGFGNEQSLYNALSHLKNYSTRRQHVLT